MQGPLLLKPLRVKTQKNLGYKLFQLAATFDYGKLPSAIRAIRGYNLFKGAVETYLFKKASMVTPRASVIMIIREF